MGAHNFVQKHGTLANPLGEVPPRRVQALLVFVEHFKVETLLKCAMGNAFISRKCQNCLFLKKISQANFGAPLGRIRVPDHFRLAQHLPLATGCANSIAHTDTTVRVNALVRVQILELSGKAPSPQIAIFAFPKLTWLIWSALRVSIVPDVGGRPLAQVNPPSRCQRPQQSHAFRARHRPAPWFFPCSAPVGQRMTWSATQRTAKAPWW